MVWFVKYKWFAMFVELSSHASYEEIRDDTVYSTTLRYHSRSDAGSYIGTMLDMNREESCSSRLHLEEGASCRFHSEEGASGRFQHEEGNETSLRCSSYATVPVIHDRPNMLDIDNLKFETQVVSAEINRTP